MHVQAQGYMHGALGEPCSVCVPNDMQQSPCILLIINAKVIKLEFPEFCRQSCSPPDPH